MERLYLKVGRFARNVKMMVRNGSIALCAGKSRLYGNSKKTDIYADALTKERTGSLLEKRQLKRSLTGIK